MSIKKLIDPEFTQSFESLPEYDAKTFAALLESGDLSEFRQTLELNSQKMVGDQPAFSSVVFEDRIITRASDNLELPIRIYQPINHSPASPLLPVLLYMHGGSFMFGSPTHAEYNTLCSRIVEQVHCLLVSVDYRLAPEHPFPAAPEDCYAALLWLADNANNLGIDENRMAIGGHSAGGCLAAAVARMARDRNGPALIYQLLVYPCLDDREEAYTSKQTADPELQKIFRLMWKGYLGKDYQGEVSSYAAPARAENLTGLPPAYILAAELDLLLDEAVAYSRRLTQSEVSTELHVFPGAVHGFDMLLDKASLSQRAINDYIGALKNALK